MGFHREHRWLDNGLRSVAEDLIDDRKLAAPDKFRGTGSISGKVEPWICIHRRIEDSRTAPNHCLVVPKTGGPRKAKPWRPIRVVSEYQIVT